MVYVWATLLVLLNTIWLATVIAGLPGTWLMVVCTALLAWWKWEDPAAGQALSTSWRSESKRSCFAGASISPTSTP